MTETAASVPPTDALQTVPLQTEPRQAAQTPPPPAEKPVVEVYDLVHSFRSRRVLDNISFSIPAKSLHGFVGPNGAGKTTTLRIICTLLKPAYGEVRVFGHDVVTNQFEVRQRIGFMPDHFSTYRQMTVFEYLDFFGAAYGMPTRKRNQVIEEVLALTDMSHRSQDLLGGLSRGMQQRVSLSRVLINDPDLLLLDEPASGLDPRARIELMEILRALRQMGKTIFISSHILSELSELCDSVTVIDRGEIRYSGTMRQLLARTEEHPVFRLTTGQVGDSFISQLSALPGVLEVTPVPQTMPPEFQIRFDWMASSTNELLTGILALGVPITGFIEERRHLNDVFLDLTTQGVR